MKYCIILYIILSHGIVSCDIVSYDMIPCCIKFVYNTIQNNIMFHTIIFISYDIIS